MGSLTSRLPLKQHIPWKMTDFSGYSGLSGHLPSDIELQELMIITEPHEQYSMSNGFDYPTPRPAQPQETNSSLEWSSGPMTAPEFLYNLEIPQKQDSTTELRYNKEVKPEEPVPLSFEGNLAVTDTTPAWYGERLIPGLKAYATTESTQKGLKRILKLLRRGELYYETFEGLTHGGIQLAAVQSMRHMDTVVCQYYSVHPEELERVATTCEQEIPGKAGLHDIFARDHPEIFLSYAFGISSEAEARECLTRVHCDYDEDMPIHPNDWYAMWIAARYSHIVNQLFAKSHYWATARDQALHEFSKYTYRRNTGKNRSDYYIHDNCGRDKLSSILGILIAEIMALETVIEVIAEELQVKINGKRIPADQPLVDSQGKVVRRRRKTWNQKPEAVKERVYAVVKRALWDSLGFSSEIVQLLVKRDATCMAQNKFKRSQNGWEGDGRGVDGMLNVIFRKNAVEWRNRVRVGKGSLKRRKSGSLGTDLLI